MFRTALLLALVALPLAAQELKLPAEVKGKPGEFVVISATTTDPQVRWFGIDAGLNLFPAHLLKDSKTAVVTALVPGRYRVLAVSAKGDIPSAFAECLVVIGDPGPTPTPTPVPDPTPPPVPTTGPRGVMLIRESSSQNSRTADLVRDLRNPVTAEFKYLKDKGHQFSVIDPDQVGSDGKKLIEKYQEILAGMTLPVILVYDPKGSRPIIIRESIPADTSDPNVVLNLIKKAGG